MNEKKQNLPDYNEIERYGKVIIYKNNEGKFLYYIDIISRITDFTALVGTILEDDNIEEIMYNGSIHPVRVFHHSYGMCDTNFFEANLLYSRQGIKQFISRTAILNRRKINSQNPILDGVLEDGSRINIVIPPASLDISITIRRFKHSMLTPLDFIKDNFCSSEIVAFLWTFISRIGNPANILFIGGTASGKTTALNAFSLFINQSERIVVIEDTPELQLKQPNIVRMVANKEKDIDMDVLLETALRMRPDRIIVGEVRGKEALTLFTALNTGHDGCFGTLHANSARECIQRITRQPMNVPLDLLKELNLIVVLKKFPSGQRYVEEITEISGMDSKNVRFNTLFEWDPKEKKCIPTGIPSRSKAKLAESAGLAITDVDKLIKERREILEKLIEDKANLTNLISTINKNK